MSINDEVYSELERAFTEECARREGLVPSKSQCDVLRFAANLIVDRFKANGITEATIRNSFCTVLHPLRSFRVATVSMFNHAVEVLVPSDDGKVHWWMISGELYTERKLAERAIAEIANRLGLGKRYQVDSPVDYQRYAGKTFGYIAEEELRAMWKPPVMLPPGETVTDCDIIITRD